MRSFHTKIVGVTFSNDDGSHRQRIIAMCTLGEQLTLAREPDNPFDANAVRVYRTLTGQQLGHLSRELAATLVDDIEDWSAIGAEISSLTGGVPGKPTRGVNILIQYEAVETKARAVPRSPRPVTTTIDGLPKRRLSLTKMQRVSVAGAELLSLCREITEDGNIDDQEILDLRQWLNDHTVEDLPAIAYLSNTVEKILADGRVEPLERDELYVAILKILPPDVRAVAAAAQASQLPPPVAAHRPSSPMVEVRPMSMPPAPLPPRMAPLPEETARSRGVVSFLRRLFGPRS